MSSAFLSLTCLAGLGLPALQEAPGPEPQDAGPEKTVEHVAIETRDGLKLFAEIYLPHEDPSTPFLVLFHQARSSRGEYRQIAPRLKALGYNCMAVDLRSGKSCGEVMNLSAKTARKLGHNPTYLDALVDVEDSLAWARANHARGKLVAWGSSFSASLVLHVAGTRPELLDGAIAFAPGEYFSTLGKGATWIRDSARQVRCPVFVGSARSEKAEWQPIFEAMPTEAKTGFVPEAEGAHGSKALWKETPGHEEYWKALEAFLSAHFPPSRAK